MQVIQASLNVFLIDQEPEPENEIDTNVNVDDFNNRLSHFLMEV